MTTVKINGASEIMNLDNYELNFGDFFLGEGTLYMYITTDLPVQTRELALRSSDLIDIRTGGGAMRNGLTHLIEDYENDVGMSFDFEDHDDWEDFVIYALENNSLKLIDNVDVKFEISDRYKIKI